MKITKSIIQLGALASFGLASAVALADGPGYTYVELGYADIEIDVGGGFDISGDGYALGGSAEVGENIFIFADYADVGFDIGIDFNAFDVGVGYKSPVSDTTDVNISLAYVDLELEDPFFGSVSEDGYGLGASIRSMLSNEFELNGGITYVDLGTSGGDDTSFDFGAVYSFNENFAVTGDISIGDDVTTFIIAGRYYTN